MLYSIIQIIAFQALFLMVYDLFLRKETFFNHNRAYLLITSIVSLVLPFVKFPELQKMTSKDVVIKLPEVFIGPEIPTEYDVFIAEQAGIVIEQPQTPMWQILAVIGVIVATLIFTFKIARLYWLRNNNPKRWHKDVLIVKLLKSSAAFTFFNTIFLGEQIPEAEKPTIYNHELIHVKERHTLDLLFFELLRIVLWFNPLIYIYQSRIRELHEFIADAKAVKQNGKKEYYQSLLNQVFDVNDVSFTNTFFKRSLIKKRIAMLQKSQSKQFHLIKYTLLIPLIFGMLIYTSTEVRAQQRNQNIDLNQYSYTLSKGESLTGKKKEIHDKYEGFLKSNKDYVSWAIIDHETKVVSYSVHHKNEVLPEGYEEAQVSFPDGESYISYMNFRVFSDTEEEVDEIEEVQQVEYVQQSNRGNYDNELEVPFSLIEEAPTTKECKDLSTQVERKKCISRFIQKHVNKNFDISIGDALGLKGKQRIFVSFKIDKSGNLKDVKARAAKQELEDEAIRVINKLPQFIPGRQKGKNVIVPYSLPIVFQIVGNDEDKISESRKELIAQRDRLLKNTTEENPVVKQLTKQIDSLKQKISIPEYNKFIERLKKSNSLPKDQKKLLEMFMAERLKEKEEKGTVSLVSNSQKNSTVPYAIVEKSPVHPDCKTIEDNEERKRCTSAEVSKFVNHNFNKDMASTLDLPDGQQRIFGAFTIDKQGFVKEAKARGPHEKLEEEFVRVINLLPQFIPGENEGEKVDVPFSLPIVFRVFDKKNKN